MRKTRVRSLGWEDPLEKEMAIHSSTTAWVGKIPWRRKWQSTPVLLPVKSHGQRGLVGYSPWGRKKLDTTELLHFYFISPILEPVTKYFSLSYFVIVYLCRV